MKSVPDGGVHNPVLLVTVYRQNQFREREGDEGVSLAFLSFLSVVGRARQLGTWQ